MLQPAILWTPPLVAAYRRRMFDSDTKYYHFQWFVDSELTIDSNDWKRIQFVSASGNELHAYMEARVDRSSNCVEDLLILGLYNGRMSATGTHDVMHFLRYLLLERGFRKIFFRFVSANPAGRQYQKLFVETAHCGSIQGVLKDAVRLSDGQIYDITIMDIQQSSFLDWYFQRYDRSASELGGDSHR